MNVVDAPAIPSTGPSPAGSPPETLAAARRLVVDFGDIRRGAVARYGGKNASLGEMVGVLGDRHVAVPGFATAAELTPIKRTRGPCIRVGVIPTERVR